MLETSLEMSNALAEAPINDYDHYLSLQQIVNMELPAGSIDHQNESTNLIKE